MTGDEQNSSSNVLLLHSRAIFISCTSCLVIYVLTIVAFHTTLSPSEVLGSEAVAVTFANRSNRSALTGKVIKLEITTTFSRMYGRFASIIPFFVACSTFGAVNGTLLTSSR